MLRIIDTDNFGGDYPNEKVIADNILNELFAREICDFLNEKWGGSRYYKIVDENYELQPGFEP